MALATITQALSVAAIAVLVGGLTLDALLPRPLAELAPARRLLRRSAIGAIAVLLVTTAAELVVRSSTMAAGDLATAVRAIPTVLADTHFGRIWIARGAALCLAWILTVRRADGPRVLALLACAGVALTTSLTGHAADRGDLSVAVALDWIHVLAAAAWTGGLISLGLSLRARAGTWSPPRRGRVMAAFSALAGWCLLAVAATGAYNAWTELPGPRALWTTGYGRVLALKLLLVAALVWWGAVNRYTVLPRLAPSGSRVRHASRIGRLIAVGVGRSPDPDASATLASYLRREAIVALLVFGCTAVLVNSEPPHQGGHEHHPMESRARVTGEREPLPAAAADGEAEASLRDMVVHRNDPVPHRVAPGLDR